MHRLEILGRIDLRDHNGRELRGILAQPKRLALLAYLCVQAKTSAIRRDEVLALFWPELDQERARKALNKAVHFLRQELGENVVVSRTSEELAIDVLQLTCDAVDFMRAVAKEDHVTALDLYRGEVLPAFHIEGASGFETWLEEARFDVRQMAARSSRALAEQRERDGQHTTAVHFARRAVELSDEDERTVRQLLELLDRLGDRAGALYAYDRFERRMAAEFSATPAAETQALIASIRARVDVDSGSVRADVARIEQPSYTSRSDESLIAAFQRRGYKIVRELARGGMAAVYLARDVKHDRHVALKVLSHEIGALHLSDRFTAEIRVTANLQHPNILPLFDSGEVQGTLYYAMPYIEGESLRLRLDRDKQLTVHETVALIHTLAAALEYAHKRGVIHRDIKPENILLQDAQPLLADFGIALALSTAGVERVTATGLSLGTPQYMSPEQAAGELALGPQSDIYSLAAVAYEMLVGEPPFTGPNTRAVLARVMLDVPKPISARRDGVPPHLESAIMRALEKHPADRFESAEAFSRSLQIPPATRTFSETRRSYVRAIPLAVAAALVLGASVWGARSTKWPGLTTLIQGRQQGPEWLLVADLDASSSEQEIATAVRELVSTVLNEPKRIATIPREELREARRAAMMPDTAQLNAERARHLAARSAVRTIVAGRLDRVGRGTYSVVLRAVNVSDGVQIAAANGISGEDSIMSTVAQIARDLRAQLARTRHVALDPLRGKGVVTPSFQAYRTYLEAAAYEDTAGELPQSQRLLRQAVTIDPDFAEAWRRLAFTYQQRNFPDSARLAYGEALRSAYRLTDAERLLLQSNMARDLDGNQVAALGFLDKIVQQGLADADVYDIHSLTLVSLGRYEEGLESCRLGLKAAALRATPINVENCAERLAAAGYVDEARAVSRSLTGALWRDAEIDIAIAAAEWSRAESLAVAWASEPTSTPREKANAGIIIASSQITRGQVADAKETLRRSSCCGRPATPFLQFALSVISGSSALPERRALIDSLAPRGTVRGLWFSWYGDTLSAKRELAYVRALPSANIDIQRPHIRLLEASIAARGGQWRDVVRLLSADAWQGIPGGMAGNLMTRRWLVADAYEHLDMLDSAVAYFELLDKPTRSNWWQHESRGVSYPFALRRLALLHARAGRHERAREYWRKFVATFTNADAKFQPLVTEARSALNVSTR